ncbi:MAG: hypothetical protein JKY08_08365 [Flavobacteriaceae bacterium]|nr:hypothetical protein [Flavobacteriaceae bacterium]
MKTIQPLLILLLILITAFSTPSEKAYEKPIGLIDKETAILYEKNYVNHQYKYINEYVNKHLSEGSNTPFKDNREVFFTLENLENYLAYVKNNAKTKGYKNLGIRIYFAAKKDTEGVYKSTVFLSPTHQPSSNKATRNSRYSTSSTNVNTTDIMALNYGSSGEPDEYIGN